MTLPQYIDEVKLRMIRLMVVMELNDSEMAMYVNQAKRDVQRMTISSHTERYGKITDLTEWLIDPRYSIQRPYGQANGIVYAVRLPKELIDVHVVIYNDGETIRSEARYYDMRELYGVGMHSWNTPTPVRPIYTVIDNYIAYAPDSTMLFSIGKNMADEASIRIWYTAAVQGLDLYDNAYVYGNDNDTTMPTELQELIILYSVRAMMQRIEAPQAAESVATQIQFLESSISTGYKIDKQKVASLLPSQGAI